jgi:hypothetical protein
MCITLEWIKKIESKEFNQLSLPAIIIKSLAPSLDSDPHHDALNLFRQLAKDGIIAFDDHGYGKNLEAYKNPTPANNFFLIDYKNEIESIKLSYKVWIVEK